MSIESYEKYLKNRFSIMFFINIFLLLIWFPSFLKMIQQILLFGCLFGLYTRFFFLSNTFLFPFLSLEHGRHLTIIVFCVCFWNILIPILITKFLLIKFFIFFWCWWPTFLWFLILILNWWPLTQQARYGDRNIHVTQWKHANFCYI